MDQRGTYRICIPPRFFQNHSERDSPPLGKIIERTKRGVVIECNKAEMEEWLSQAQIYSTCAGSTIGGIPVAHHNLGLQASARATVQRIELLHNHLEKKEG
jgi:hypothetical protein|tara:strand:+ start:2039 stop:2341 length:303 start_codon:yes stop_codon:yes gene_type:complete